MQGVGGSSLVMRSLAKSHFPKGFPTMFSMRFEMWRWYIACAHSLSFISVRALLITPLYKSTLIFIYSFPSFKFSINFSISSLSLFFINFAGFPPITENGSTSFVTTLPIPIMLPIPIFTPGTILTESPIHTPFFYVYRSFNYFFTS